MAATAPPRPAKKPATRKNVRTPGAATNGRAKALLAAATAAPPAAAGTLPVGSIEPDHFVNPRGPVDKKSPAFLELVASVKGLGLLEPIVVGPALADGGKHPIIAGWRRYAAATAAKLKAVPVHQVAITDAKDALVAALAENVARDDMTPLSEGRAIDLLMREHGYTQVEAGKAIGMAERTVRERLRLLKIHAAAPGVGAAIDRGAVPMDAAVLLQTVSSVAPNLALALVVGADNDALDIETWTANDLTKPEEVHTVISWFVDEFDNEEITGHFGEIEELYGWSEHARWYGEALPLTEKQLARWKAIEPEQYRSTPPGFGLTAEDLEEGRAAGQVLEIAYTDRWKRPQRAIWVTRAFWTEERLETKLVALERDGAKRAKAKAKHIADTTTEGPAGSGTNTPASGKAVDAATAKAKAKEAREKEVAHHRNAILGERSASAFDDVALSLPAAKFVALLALENHDAYRLANRGLRYCESTWLTEEARKNGSVKRTYKDLHTDRIREQIEAATTPAEAIAPVLRAYALARLADERVVAMSNRSWWSLPGDGIGGFGTGTLLAELIDLADLERDIDKEAEQRADATPPGKPLAEVLDEGDEGDEAATSPVAEPNLKGKTIEEQAVALVTAHPGITIPELAEKLDRKQNYLYRVLPGLATAGRVEKQGRGWHAVAS